jgi:hypothetical protein
LTDLTIRPNHALRGEIADYRQARQLPEMPPLTSVEPQNAHAPTTATTTVLHNGRVINVGRLQPHPLRPRSPQQQQQQPEQANSAMQEPLARAATPPIPQHMVALILQLTGQMGINMSGMDASLLLKFTTDILTNPPFPTVSVSTS